MGKASRTLTILNKHNNCKFRSPKFFKTTDSQTLATPRTWWPSRTRRISSKLNQTIIRRQNWWVTSSKIWRGRKIGSSYQQEVALAISKVQKVWMSRLIPWPKCYTANLAKISAILSNSNSLKACKWHRPSILSRTRKLMSGHLSNLLCRQNLPRMVDSWRIHSKGLPGPPEPAASTTILHHSSHKIVTASKTAWLQRPTISRRYPRPIQHKSLCENKNIMILCKWISSWET